MSMVIYTLYTQGPRFVESHICQNRADTRISCTRSQRVPRVRLSLRKAAWSYWKPTSFTGNTGYGAPVIRYGPGREKFRLKVRRRGKCFTLAECHSGTSPDNEGEPLVAREVAGDDQSHFHQDHR
jgi:hypothetical protein